MARVIVVLSSSRSGSGRGNRSGRSRSISTSSSRAVVQRSRARCSRTTWHDYYILPANITARTNPKHDNMKHTADPKNPS